MKLIKANAIDFIFSLSLNTLIRIAIAPSSGSERHLDLPFLDQERAIPYNDFMVQILPYREVDSSSTLQAIKEIFYLSASKQSFSSPDERESFFQKWTAYYFEFCREDIWVATEKDVIGYLTGCKDSSLASSFFRERLPSYMVFADLFTRFPAHLHVNLHPSARGKGVGSSLVNMFCESLVKQSICGAHLVTSPQMRNVSFYERLGFTEKTERSWKGSPLLCMGKPL